MVIAIALPEFNDLGRLVTHIFLLLVIFPCQFSTSCKQMKKIYRILQNASSISIIFRSLFICAVVSSAS